MKREEVAELASNAGFGGNQRNTLAVKLERFAALVAASERERCAKVCERLQHDTAAKYVVYDQGSSDRKAWNEGTVSCAKAIRALETA